MGAFLFDADSIINLHSLGLVGTLCQALGSGVLTARCTPYVWLTELCTLEADRKALENAGLQVHPIVPASPEGTTFKRMLKERGNLGRNSKGEIQLIAFAQHFATPLTLVCCDRGAQTLARERGIAAMHLSHFICEMVILGILSEADARQAVAGWDNPGAGNGRPRGYAGFDALLAGWRRDRA